VVFTLYGRILVSGDVASHAFVCLLSGLYGSKLTWQIKELLLDVGVAWIGEHLDSYVLNAADQASGRPLLFFNWVPNILTSGDQFSHVHFPVCNDAAAGEEFADDGTFRLPSACDFEVHQLTKVMWSLLKTHTPEAYHLVSSLQFTSVELDQFLESYVRIWKDAASAASISLAEARQRSTEFLEQAACEWVRNNELVWQSWLPEKLLNKPTIYLGGMFPLTGPYWRLPGAVPGQFVIAFFLTRGLKLFQFHHACSSGSITAGR
jgi:hypothetical protein